MENHDSETVVERMDHSYLDLRPDTALIEICDNKRVLIENHQGITCYECNEIVVKVKNGRVSVCGDKLRLSRMNKTKLVISGVIHTVHIQKVNCNA